MLKPVFFRLAQKYSNDNDRIEMLWQEIEKNHSDKKRHYHTLAHLQNILDQLAPYKEEIQNWDAILFAVFYHDFVYNVLKQDNEEKSAELSCKNLQLLGVDNATIEKCNAAILATKKHELNKDNDINLFTDADLSILGADWNVYTQYAKQIRKEYSVYPDLLYIPGRKKVLNHFLHMKNIFKSSEFSAKYENQARENAARELKEL